MNRDYLTCREMVELVTEYLEGVMPPRERVIFEAHLAVCPGCTAYFEQMKQTIRLLGKLPEDSIEPEARDTLLHAFRNWKRTTTGEELV
ncbi:MAG: zf-HC2 domain-containing protein [Chloroflexi bacterium SZAS-1]|nr:zf-HC2 domain-containing protein [Chloroflexi bacterium SZAS-1]HNP85273.1 zf-HC2 domain-containing protein [Kouleothrix sp.]